MGSLQLPHRGLLLRVVGHGLEEIARRRHCVIDARRS
jgi:hypothetical protein